MSDQDLKKMIQVLSEDIIALCDAKGSHILLDPTSEAFQLCRTKYKFLRLLS